MATITVSANAPGPAADPIALRACAAMLALRASLWRDNRSKGARGLAVASVNLSATFHAFRSNTVPDLLSFDDPCLDRPYEILRPISLRGENESFAPSIEAKHGSGARIGELELVPASSSRSRIPAT